MNENWKNPYVAGSPIRGEEMFFGREEIFTWLRTHLIGQFQDNPIVLYGERRTGKTSILYQIPRRLGDPAYIPIFIDLQQLSPDSMGSFLWQVATKIWSGLPQVDRDQLNRPARKDFVEESGVHFADIFLSRIQEIVGQRKLLIMFDEFSRMSMMIETGDLPVQIFDYLRSLMADHRLTFIVSLGSKLEEMEAKYSVLFNQAIYHQITFLNPTDARNLIIKPVASYYSYQAEAVDFILKATFGHPFYIQHICHAVFSRRVPGETQPVTMTAVKEVLSDVVEATAQNLKFTWDDIGPVEKAVLAALASVNNKLGTVTARADLVRILRHNELCPPEGELTAALQTLRTRDILGEAIANQYNFTIEPLRLWLSKERRLDFVRQELIKEGVIDRWRQSSSSTLSRSWLRQPIFVLPMAMLLLILGICVVLLIWIIQHKGPESDSIALVTPSPIELPTVSSTSTLPVLSSTLEEVRNASVRITGDDNYTDLNGKFNSRKISGSGFIIDESGIAVTANYFVTGVQGLKVYVGTESESHNVKALGWSECFGLAVIDIEGDKYQHLEWYDGPISVGVNVYAAGFPFGAEEYTVTSGIISRERVNGQTDWLSIDRLIEHDATLNPGSSGGPLVNEEGKVVGINVGANSQANLSYAIASIEARPIIAQLSQGQNALTIGINGQAFVTKTKDQPFSGIWVKSVQPNSPADQVGIKGGDIIIKLEGQNLAEDGTMRKYCDILRSHNLDVPLSIQIVRLTNGEVLEGQLNGHSLEVISNFKVTDLSRTPTSTP